MAYLASTMVAAAAAAAQKRIIDHLRARLATSHERAVSYVPEQRGDERWLQVLLKRGVVVEAAPGRYWLNERTQESHPAARKVLLLALVAALLAIALGAALLGGGL